MKLTDKHKVWLYESITTVGCACHATMMGTHGWPHEYVVLDLPQHEHRGPRSGQRTGDAAQPVLVVPVTWMRRLAELVDRRMADMVRGKVEDE